MIGIMLAAVFAGVATVRAAHWLDGHIALLLDEGWVSALDAPGRGPGRWWIQGMAAAVAVATVLPVPSGGAAWGVLTLESALAICAWIDWRHRIIPDVVCLPLAAAGLLVAPLSMAPAGGLPPALAGAVLGLALGGVVRWLGELGWGDVKLLGAIGCWVGPLMVCLLFLTCCLLMIPLLLRRRSGGDGPLPMAPVLALVTVPAVLAMAANTGNANSLYLMNKIPGSICISCYSDDVMRIPIQWGSK